MNELNSILRENQIINIINENGETKPLKFKKLTAIRALEVGEKYNKLMMEINDSSKAAPESLKPEEKIRWSLENNLKNTKRYLIKLVDLCLDIIRPKNIFDRIKYKREGNWITKKYILENFDQEAIESFLKMILNTYNPTEKKTEKVQVKS